jgi:hypothetical protein
LQGRWDVAAGSAGTIALLAAVLLFRNVSVSPAQPIDKADPLKEMVARKLTEGAHSCSTEESHAESFPTYRSSQPKWGSKLMIRPHPGKAVLAVVAIMALAQVTPVMAETAPGSAPIEIAYVPPALPYLQPVYERLKQRKVLEQLRDFLSPLILPVTLRITALQCGETNAFWAGRAEGLKLCYEYVDWVERLAPAETTPEGFTPQDAIAGEFVEVTLHEMGHAVFDLFEVPVFGREEDAADEMAGFLMLQFGQDVALRTIGGTAYTYQQQALQSHWSRTTFADEHETDQQRFYNYLCLAYGAQPATFQRFVDSNLLPAKRAANCGREYRQVQRAFMKTVMPHIDQELMKKVQAMQMLRPDDGILKRDYAQ